MPRPERRQLTVLVGECPERNAVPAAEFPRWWFRPSEFGWSFCAGFARGFVLSSRRSLPYHALPFQSPAFFLIDTLLRKVAKNPQPLDINGTNHGIAVTNYLPISTNETPNNRPGQLRFYFYFFCFCGAGFGLVRVLVWCGVLLARLVAVAGTGLLRLQLGHFLDGLGE
jgi:hypothetical protein